MGFGNLGGCSREVRVYLVLCKTELLLFAASLLLSLESLFVVCWKGVRGVSRVCCSSIGGIVHLWC